jgi:hypothetical protein
MDPECFDRYDFDYTSENHVTIDRYGLVYIRSESTEYTDGILARRELICPAKSVLMEVRQTGMVDPAN